MNRDDVLLALYNRKIKKNGKHFLIWDDVLNCNIPVTQHINYFKNEEYINSDMTLTKEGKKAVMDVMAQRMKQ